MLKIVHIAQNELILSNGIKNATIKTYNVFHAREEENDGQFYG